LFLTALFSELAIRDKKMKACHKSLYCPQNVQSIHFLLRNSLRLCVLNFNLDDLKGFAEIEKMFVLFYAFNRFNR
ncbi:hypothetical protein MM239_12890, partial [Belliella sp. DSM 111904]